MEKAKSIPIGTLVEIEETGVRLFVVNESQDCDGTPLYCLCHDKYNIKQLKAGFINKRWIGFYPRESLKIIKPSSHASKG